MSEPTPPAPENQPPPPPTTAITAAPPAAAVTAAPPKPAAPVKPAAAKPADKGRRNFLATMFGSWIAVAWVALGASVTGLTLGTVRFLFPNVLSEPPSSFRAGNVGNFEENRVDDRFKEQGAWVIRAKD